MRACHNCLHWDVCSVREDDIACGIYNPKEKRNVKPQTNADRIRAMTDEELAEMLWKTGRNYRSVCADPVVDYNEHRDHLIAWLKQPAE